MSDPQADFDFNQQEFDAAKLDAESYKQELEASIGTDRDAVKSEMRNILETAKQALDLMKISKNNLPVHARQSANEAYTARRREYESLEKLIEGGRNEPARYSDNPSEHRKQREQQLESTERLNSSSRRINDAAQSANSTLNGMGDLVLDLRGQRDRIGGTIDTLHQAERPLDNSIRTVGGMERRRRTNKLIMYAIISVLVLLILFVLASKFRRNWK